MELPFSKEEVFSTLSTSNGDKVPCPDGFTMAFWHVCWDIIKNKVFSFFKEFYEQGLFQRSLNTTFLVLITNKGEVEDFKDFKLISLMGSP